MAAAAAVVVVVVAAVVVGKDWCLAATALSIVAVVDPVDPCLDFCTCRSSCHSLP